MSDVSRLLDAAAVGDPNAASELLPLVYDELRKLAAAKLSSEQPGQTLDATGLVHEAYLRLVGDRAFENRGHFFATAAEAMRRILVDRARAKRSQKRGGTRRRLQLEDVQAAVEEEPEEFLALHEALKRLEAAHPRKAALVQLRVFAGLTGAQAAEALGVSQSTADNDWAYAKAWLRLELEKS